MRLFFCGFARLLNLLKLKLFFILLQIVERTSIFYDGGSPNIAHGAYLF